jgi:anti-anti-sigma factor
VVDDFSVTRVAERSWTVEGELDLATAPQLQAALLSEAEPGDLKLDCIGLRFMDSQGVRTLLRVASARPPGGQLVLQRLTPEVRRIAELVQLGSIPGIQVED